MIHTPVVSSTVAAVGYSENRLYVGFKNGTYYSYEGVPFGLYEQLVVAESAGKFLNAHVKGPYPFTKLDHNPFPIGVAA